MSKIVLITGGTRSGKSSFGEKLLKDSDDVLYIATSKVFDSEMAERVRLHKERRNPKWETYEGYKDISKVIESTEKSKIMLECVGTMVTNLMFDIYEDFEGVSKEDVRVMEHEILKEFTHIIEAVKNYNKEVILISNEVGLGLVSEYKLGRIFTDILGRINQKLGEVSDQVYLTACGIPLKLK